MSERVIPNGFWRDHAGLPELVAPSHGRCGSPGPGRPPWLCGLAADHLGSHRVWTDPTKFPRCKRCGNQVPDVEQWVDDCGCKRERVDFDLDRVMGGRWR